MHDAMMSPSRFSNQPNLPQKLVDQLRAELEAIFDQTLNAFMSALPGQLMERAEGQPPAAQQHYLDIIAGMRRSRQDILNQVSPAMDGVFSAFLMLDKKDEADPPRGGLDLMSLSLVDSSDMEVQVSLDTLSTRLSTRMEPVVTDAFQRLQAVMPGLQEMGQLPFHPKALMQAMLDSFAVLQLDAQQKRILVELFAPLIAVSQLRDLIEPALEATGVPELDRTIRNDGGGAARTEAKPDLADVLRDIRDMGQRGGGTGGAGSSSAEGEAQLDDKGVPILHRAPGGGLVVEPELLMRQAEHFAQISRSVAAVPLTPANVSPLAMEQVIATPVLTTLLTRLQELQPRTHVDVDPTAPSVSEVRDSIRQQLKSDDDTVEVISKKDTDVINLLSMMFDFILDDDDLPTAMKALLGRLQIPMLKVAILDDKFFKTEDHPARRLLNSLAKAGVGWDENAKSSDQLYKKLEETVFTILNEFESDIGLFDRLLVDFEGFYSEQQSRVAVVDERTREAEENRARAELARTIVQQTLNKRLNGRKLPFAVVRILQEGWRHVLYLACLKEGTDSESWRQAVKVVDALVWSVLPPEGDAQWIDRLRNISPKLVNSLRKGLASVHFDALQTESLLQEISTVHKEIIEGFEMPLVEVLDPEEAQKQPDFNGTPVDDALRHTNPSMMTGVVLPKAEPEPLYSGDTLPETDPHVQMVRQITIGTWIEFIHAERRDRHKLVARIRTSEKLIFANRRGIKVAEMSQMQLAVDFSQGRARIVDEQPQIIDRALQSVVGELRQLNA